MNIIWNTEKRKISDLIPAEYNPREMTEKQAEDLNRSLTKFSLADPIVINKDNTIIGGHQRIKILSQQGTHEVDVRIPDRQLTDEEERELNLRLNRNLGQWDFDALANFDEDMLIDVGFDSAELDKIFQLDAKPEDDDVPEVPEEAVTKLGDIYTLGNHRLMCGDSTKVDDVEKLMNGKKADMVFTDPPYGINLEGDNSKRGKSTSLMKGGLKLKSFKDDTTQYAIDAWNLCQAFGITKQVWWGANYYCHSLPETNNWLVWDKRCEDKMTNTNSDSRKRLNPNRLRKNKPNMLRNGTRP